MAHDALLQRIDAQGLDQRHPLSTCARMIRHARDPHVRAVLEVLANDLYQEKGELGQVEQLVAKAQPPLLTTMERREALEAIMSAVIALGLEDRYGASLAKLAFDIRSEAEQILKRKKH